MGILDRAGRWTIRNNKGGYEPARKELNEGKDPLTAIAFPTDKEIDQYSILEQAKAYKTKFDILQSFIWNRTENLTDRQLVAIRELLNDYVYSINRLESVAKKRLTYKLKNEDPDTFSLYTSESAEIEGIYNSCIELKAILIDKINRALKEKEFNYFLNENNGNLSRQQRNSLSTSSKGKADKLGRGIEDIDIKINNRDR